MKKKLKSGCIPSPYDYRDFPCGSAIELKDDIEIPETYQVWQPNEIKDQGEVGSCVAHALADIAECIDHKYGKEYKKYSIGGIYGTSELVYGMYPREACSAFLNEGNVLQEVWECLKENPKCRLARQEVWENIKDETYKIAEFVRINSKKELQSFMLKYQLPVMITAQGKKFSPLCSDGYHAVACYGWISKNDFIAINGTRQEYKDIMYTNSWGTGGVFGNGRGYIRFEDLNEIWGIVPMEKKKFSDIEGRWSQKAIEYCADKGYVNGYADGTFQPTKPITREEMAQILYNLDNKK